MSEQRRPYWCMPRPPDTGPPDLHKAPKLINLSRLAPDRKRKVWENIKVKNPALANLYQDFDFQSLVKAFDAQILVKLDDLHANSDDDQPTRRDKKPP